MFSMELYEIVFQLQFGIKLKNISQTNDLKLQDICSGSQFLVFLTKISYIFSEFFFSTIFTSNKFTPLHKNCINKLSSIKVILHRIQCATPLFCCWGGGWMGLNLLPKFQKGGLDRTLMFRGDWWERRGDLLRGLQFLKERQTKIWNI